MGYVEERIKFLAVQAWRNNRTLKPIECENENCEGKIWGGIIVPEMHGGVTIMMCDDCGQEQETIPEKVIDRYLESL